MSQLKNSKSKCVNVFHHRKKDENETKKLKGDRSRREFRNMEEAADKLSLSL